MGQHKHILVVDPDGGVRDMIAAILEDRGYRVSCVPDGPSMRRLLESDGCDAIVIDASMRGETSTSLANHAKALRLPLVMLSGNDVIMGYAADHGLQLLHKPFRIQALCDALDRAFASGEFGRRGA
jgi:DNA-binding NtrC family response regulator